MNSTKRKRIAKRQRKNKKWKRQEYLFNPSSDNGRTANNLKSSINGHCEQILSLTPSKSETEADEMESDAQWEESDVSCVLTEDFELDDECDSEGEHGYSIVEAFVNRDSNNYTQIVSSDAIAPKVKSLDKEIINPKPQMVKEKLKPQPVCVINDLLSHDAQYYNTEDGIILLLRKNETVYFYGLALLSVLHGQVEILGYTLDKNTPEIKVYSFRGSSLLYLKNITMSNLSTNYLNLKIEVTNRCAIVLCKKLPDPNILFIEKHISQQIVPKERIVFQPKEGNFNIIKVAPRWNDLIDNIGSTTKLMICGGKGVGKTTFLRYAINKLLMKFPEVRIIDLDPGQPEFTIPGCISSVKISKPVFGVNYSHLQKPEKSIAANVNIGYEPEKYVASVQQLLETCFDEIPTLINYMGYTHGIGINILSAVIACIKPSDVLQIKSQNSKKNYKFLLEPDIVSKDATLFMNLNEDLNYRLHVIHSMSDSNDGWIAEPRQLREMCVLAYIRHMIDSDSVYESRAPKFRINLNNIILSDLKHEILHPAAINASLVALCYVENPSANFICLGWGIVRGIDLHASELVLETSEDIETLNQVTHLVSGGATLPPSLYMTPDDVIGFIPYVAEGDLVSLGQIPKRSLIAVSNK